MVLWDMRLFLAGGNITTAPDAAFFQADENFVKAAGVKIIAGRDFRVFDSGRVLINEAVVKMLGLTVQSAPGTVLHTQSGDGSPLQLEVAGVIKNYNFSSLHEDIKPMFILYSPDDGAKLLVSTNTNNYAALLGKLETAWHKNIPGAPFEYAFVDDVVQKQYEAEITFGRIINSFTLMAILISCLGLFGLAAFSAEQRSKEISIRKVLGASTRGIVQLLSKDFLSLVLIAFVIATPVSWWAMNQWLQSFAYKVPVSWWMFAAAGFVTGFIALFTVSFQAIKAAVANPVRSLKAE
jgi:putative ABC transport system permease protein